MTRATRKKKNETAHFLLSEDRIGKRVLRFILRCKKCNKEKTFGGATRHIKQTCCNREYDYNFEDSDK